jgi:hypothetical protein
VAVIHLGPYAEWALKARDYQRVFPRDPYWGHDPFWQILEEHRLLAAWSSNLPPEERVGRALCRRFCFAPYPELLRRKRPLRNLVQLIRGWAEGSCDLREVDTRGEIAAFALACRPALEQIGERIGRPPVFRWGLVTWSQS